MPLTVRLLVAVALPTKVNDPAAVKLTGRMHVYVSPVVP